MATLKFVDNPSEVARPERFELPTTRFEAEYSIQLSYGRVLCDFVNRLYLIRTAALRAVRYSPQQVSFGPGRARCGRHSPN